MRWYNTNGEDIAPIQSKGVSGGLKLPTSQPNLAPSTGGLPSTPSGGGGFSVDTLTQILTTGAKVAGTIQQQRQQSGASAQRQARIEACGRKGLGYLFSRKKRAEYQKCVDQAVASTSGAGSKSNAPAADTSNEQPQSNTMMYVGVGVGVLALIGGIIYVMRKK